jgi:PAS domain S-box-containing protein
MKTLWQVAVSKVTSESEQSERFRRMLETSSDGICEMDATGCCTYISERGAQMLGYTVEALIGKSLHETLHPPLADGRVAPRPECSLCQALETREPQRALTALFCHASGQTLPVSYAIAPIFSSSTLNGAVITFSDDSARLRAEREIGKLTAEITEAERRRTEFIAVLSHELRNPLAPIRTALQLMRKASAGNDSMTQLRDMMERQLGQLVHLVNDLMDIARLTSGRIELKKERVALQEILSSAIEASAPLMMAAGNPLTAQIPREPLFLVADETRLTQVFTNLLNNASQYSALGEPISLQVVSNREQVQVDIGDHGIGIGPEALDRIFEMFTAIGRHSEGTRGGLGIGLNLARRLVELHDGKLIATSEGAGKGSHFLVTLPLAVAATNDMSKSSSPQAAKSLQAVRVLIVDDNVDAAESLSLLLALEGHATSIAHNGLEALSKVPSFKPDIVLLDIDLPGMIGYDVARAIRALPGAENIFLVAVTGWGSAEDRRRSSGAGFDEHFTKPVDISMIELLLSTLRSRSAGGNLPEDADFPLSDTQKDPL